MRLVCNMFQFSLVFFCKTLMSTSSSNKRSRRLFYFKKKMNNNNNNNKKQLNISISVHICGLSVLQYSFRINAKLCYQRGETRNLVEIFIFVANRIESIRFNCIQTQLTIMHIQKKNIIQSLMSVCVQNIQQIQKITIAWQTHFILAS